MVLMATIADQMPGTLTTLAGVLNWLTFGAVGLLVFALGLPVAGAGLPLGAIAYRDKLAPIHAFLGAVAQLFIAAREFLEQLIGPRSEVRNPLLGKVLDVFASLAGLVPFVFALLAFIITWVGPQLSTLARQLDLIVLLAENVFRIISEILANLIEKLKDLYVGKRSPWAVIQGIIWTFRQWFKLLKEQFGALFKTAEPAFEKIPVIKEGKLQKEIRAWVEIQRLLEDAFNKVLPLIKKMTTESWLVKQIKELARRFKVIGKVLSTAEEHEKPLMGMWEAFKDDVKEYFVGKLIAAMPPWPEELKFPNKPDLPLFPPPEETFAREKWLTRGRWPQPSSLDVFTKPEGGYVFMPSADVEKELQRLRRPPFDVFAAERKTILKGKKRDELLDEAQKAEAKLRAQLFTIIDHLLPPAVADEVPRLQGIFWKLDEFLYGKKAEFPVRDLPGGERLNVKVGRIRITAPGMKDRVVRDWSADLKTALEKQPYATEAGGTDQ